MGFFLSQQNPRSTGILAVAKANNLDIEIVNVDTEQPTAEFSKANPLAKVPTFVGADVKKVEDPDGGSRAVITLDGKYLPTKPF